MRARRITRILMAWVTAFTGLLALASVGFCDDEEAKTKFYESCIVREIAKCEAKASMLNSGSQNLREYARVKVQKAEFLAEQKDSLIQKLIDEQIPLKDHSIQVYLDSRFREAIDQ